ncbi:tyrosine recombinase [Plasmodium reichenowi]|uniref:Tyrosine recombinase n=1 Tax=Plasmodium reichenowi TaxID=5854 RepID=A0A151L6G3_PLARE|nr:tyrosine recombinase, putative [Plasmodium reichenowi]KYN94529.1 tyrosine recombinase, putative [Plasmodium reichenowi]SOV81726.1 tyrosine recombinase [Plasmodium reichenowi]
MYAYFFRREQKMNTSLKFILCCLLLNYILSKVYSFNNLYIHKYIKFINKNNFIKGNKRYDKCVNNLSKYNKFILNNTIQNIHTTRGVVQINDEEETEDEYFEDNNEGDDGKGEENYDTIVEYEKEENRNKKNIKISGPLKKVTIKTTKVKRKKKKKKSTEGMKCKTCKKLLKPRVKFCVYCGTNVSVEKIKLKKYIEEIYLPIRKEEVSENTFRVEKGFWKDILPKLGKYELHELGPNNWESFLKYLKSKNCSPRTMALYQSTYQQSLKYALYRDYLKGVHNFRKIKKSTIPRRKITPLSPKEIELLLKNSSDMHRAIFALSIGIGLRPSEVLRIHWEDINFERKEIFIKGQKTKYSNTSVPMTNFAFNELLKWWEIENKPIKGLCFYSETIRNKFNYTQTKTPLKTFKTALKGAAKRAGLEISEDGKSRRIFPYLLRHSFATIAATSNPPVPLPVAQAIMRHSSSKMLLDTYTKAGNNIIRDGLDNFKI